MVTELKAREMWTAIEAFQAKDNQAEETQRLADLAIAETWFNILGIDIQGATTRTEAYSNYTQIESLLQTETNSFRLKVLSDKLQEANEKFKERKANG